VNSDYCVFNFFTEAKASRNFDIFISIDSESNPSKFKENSALLTNRSSTTVGSQAELSGDPEKRVGDWMVMYRFMLFGSNVFDVKIDGCSIGLDPWRLTDVPVVLDE
jgi:hypothetical protein